MMNRADLVVEDWVSMTDEAYQSDRFFTSQDADIEEINMADADSILAKRHLYLEEDDKQHLTVKLNADEKMHLQFNSGKLTLIRYRLDRDDDNSWWSPHNSPNPVSCPQSYLSKLHDVWRQTDL